MQARDNIDFTFLSPTHSRGRRADRSRPYTPQHAPRAARPQPPLSEQEAKQPREKGSDTRLSRRLYVSRVQRTPWAATRARMQ